MTTSLPKHLYRCLPQRAEVLRPTAAEEGTAASTEENLYAYLNKDKAVEMALAWVLCQKYKITGFKCEDRRITIDLAKDSPPLTHASLSRISVFLHTIIPQVSDNWAPMFNPRGSTAVEWSTKKAIRTIRSASLVTMFDWLVGRTVLINHAR